jgi:SAM-dependent methyltransferase
MREPFGRSAALYDALYAERPTETECDELLALFASHGARPRSVLDLGCGTGRHAIALTRRGIEVVGVDRAKEMVAIACRRGVDARVGDMTNARLGRRFDAVVSMFHVVAYVVDDDALDRAFATARAHLETGGLYFFDTWSARAVDRDPPAPREKTALHEGGRVVRRAIPTRRGPTVEVVYEHEVGEHVFEELHVLRPRDTADLVHALERAEFRVLTTTEHPASYDLKVLARAS